MQNTVSATKKGNKRINNRQRKGNQLAIKRLNFAR